MYGVVEDEPCMSGVLRSVWERRREDVCEGCWNGVDALHALPHPPPLVHARIVSIVALIVSIVALLGTQCPAAVLQLSRPGR
eukprot:scaffold14820_cov428-Alexandrium_tamarense.AAC.1